MKIVKYETKHIYLMLKKTDSLEICSYWEGMKLGQIFSNQLGPWFSFKLLCRKKITQLIFVSSVNAYIVHIYHGVCSDPGTKR